MNWITDKLKRKRSRANLEFTLKRTVFGSDSTGGILYMGSKPMCYTVEDEVREVKVKHETCIPYGKYEVKFRDDTTKGMTAKYRSKYPWFTYHLHLQDVPNFQFIYIHVGNNDGDSSGCILVGDTQSKTDNGNVIIGNSRAAFERLYKQISGHLSRGGRVFITIE